MIFEKNKKQIYLIWESNSSFLTHAYLKKVNFSKPSVFLTFDMTLAVLGDHACSVQLVCWPSVDVHGRV